jgi:hypothetical protein
MKNKIKIWYAFILLSTSLISCTEVLDDVPRVGAVTPEEMWNNPTYVEYYINSLYNQLPSFDMDYYNNGEAASVSGVSDFLRGTISSRDAYPGAFWNYNVVRTINEFFANIDNAKIDENQKKIFKGQAHFFMAYTYFKMVRIYGGVPIITDVQDPTSDLNELMVPRNSTLETFELIEEQLDLAISLLPPRGTNGYADGRITKGAAMAVKGQVLLLKASPLFCVTKNQQFWADAYSANVAAKNQLDAEGCGLYTNSAINVHELMWYDKIGAAKEMVLSVKYQYPSKPNNQWLIASTRPISNSSGAAGAGQPTYEFVNEYPMRNGKNITDPSSGYDLSTFWKNRDPRFYSTIVFNGASYGFGAGSKRLQWTSKGMTYDGFEAVYNGTYTGFFLRKTIDTTKTVVTFPQQDFDWPLLRYAEVMLNVAECANEIGKSSEAKEYLVAIRNRVHILPGNDNNYGLAEGVGNDYNQTLDAIMKERQIEFAYEGKRLYDLRRRRMFQELRNYENLNAYAATLDKQALIDMNIPGLSVSVDNTIDEILMKLTEYIFANPTFDKDNLLKTIFRYEKIPVDRSGSGKIILPDNYYFGPLHPDWITMNPNLKQNKGWDNGEFDPIIQ